MPAEGPAIAFRERYAHLHCVTSPLSVSLYVLQSRCALHVVILSLRVLFFTLSPPSLPPLVTLTLSVLIPAAFARAALRPFLTPFPLRPNEQRRASQRRY